jgi:hypothetical protein
MSSTEVPYVGYPAPTPGLGLGWTKVADALGQTVTPEDVARIWVFPPMRRDGREWGTAIVAKHATTERFVVLTAKYMLTTRGRRRGQGRVELDEVGEGPVHVVLDVVSGVQARTADGEPPIEIAPDLWFSREDDEPTTEA